MRTLSSHSRSGRGSGQQASSWWRYSPPPRTSRCGSVRLPRRSHRTATTHWHPSRTRRHLRTPPTHQACCPSSRDRTHCCTKPVGTSRQLRSCWSTPTTGQYARSKSRSFGTARPARVLGPGSPTTSLTDTSPALSARRRRRRRCRRPKRRAARRSRQRHGRPRARRAGPRGPRSPRPRRWRSPRGGSGRRRRRRCCSCPMRTQPSCSQPWGGRPPRWPAPALGSRTRCRWSTPRHGFGCPGRSWSCRQTKCPQPKRSP